ncbi:MAG: hypothetical protein KJ607_02310 [Bacteroidetes bacterium]|nr:hypothetical protein [Bacteroidota bacterium]
MNCSLLTSTVFLSMTRLFFFTILIILTFSVKAQFLDTIREGMTHRPKFSCRFDTRNSFISTRRARISGVKIGIEFDNIFRIGGGFNWLNSEILKDIEITSGNGLTETVPGELKFMYVSYYVEYVFYRTKKWEFSLPVQAGIGTAFHKYINEGSPVKTGRKLCLVYETNISGHYKFIPWLGVGVGIGYRFMPVGNKAFDYSFNSPIYILKLKVFFGDIYRALISRGK